MSTKVDTPLPVSGLGFTTYNRETAGADQYGTKETIDAILTIGVAWWAISLFTTTPPIQIGDISRKGGGKFPPHGTHQRGRDVDIRPFRNDGKQSPVTYKDTVYDRETTRKLANLIKTLYPKAKILFNDPEIIKDGLTKWAKGHDNHLHVIFKL
jgi:conjugal transfer mating pair stabilization protein TraG